MSQDHLATTGWSPTRWSLVRRAHRNEPDARRALGELCEAYWLPIYAWLRRDGHDADTALDLTQGFLIEVLERGQLGMPDAGRFRAYVVGAVRNFALNVRRRERAALRGGGCRPLDGAAGERLLATVAADSPGPDEVFDRAWALALLERAVTTLEREFAHRGMAARFAALRPFLDGREAETTYAETAATVGLDTGALRVAVHRARARLGELIRAEIGETVDDPCLVDAELADIRQALG